MYWFARDMGVKELAPLLTAEFGSRLAADPELAERFFRMLNHESLPRRSSRRGPGPPPGQGLCLGAGRRRELARELRDLAATNSATAARCDFPPSLASSAR